MNTNMQDIGSSPNGTAQTITAQPERQAVLPVWVRAPRNGLEYFSGCSRAKLYEWARKGFIGSRSIRQPGSCKGVRLFHLQSILAFIENNQEGTPKN